MKVIVSGSRDFTNYSLFEAMMFDVLKPSELANITILEGGCRGTDMMAREFAIKWGVKWVEFPADWEKHGQSAGPIRNAELVKEGEMLIAFINIRSKGTKDIITKATAAGLKTKIFTI
mgnify:CR=1 FL=1